LAQSQERPLATIKDAAYAWRQAVFFLSLTPRDELSEHVKALRGLPSAAQWPMTEVIDGLAAAAGDERLADSPFLGWTVGPHWALSRRTD
jgi:hypothetical protein